MTCEVAVMNARGIALAADSAVTLEQSGKTYYNAEKLFQLVPDAPIGIMTYGAADFMGIPWEALIAEYQLYLHTMRYNTLVEYLNDFVLFIESRHEIFTEAAQKLSFLRIIRALWDSLYAQPWHKEADNDLNSLNKIIINDHEKWKNYEYLNIKSCFIDNIIENYKEDLKEISSNVFKIDSLPTFIYDNLNKTIKLFLTRAGFLGVHSGLVIAGMGTHEYLPQLLSCRVGPMVDNHLKFHIVEHAKITSECSAMIIPFAQREIIDMLIDGIHPDLHRDISHFHMHTLNNKQREWHEASSIHLNQKLQETISESYVGPFMEAVSAMPQYDLAMMAETLITLTAFRVNASSGSKETVGGPIDVAILSKNRGFTWIKKKSFLTMN